MKKLSIIKKLLFLTVCVFFTHTMFAQSISAHYVDNDGTIEYIKKNDDGKKIEKGYILDGKYHGKLISYDINGNVKIIANYKNGLKHGLWEIFNEKGLITYQVTYVNNKLVQASVIRHYK